MEKTLGGRSGGFITHINDQNAGPLFPSTPRHFEMFRNLFRGIASNKLEKLSNSHIRITINRML